MRRIIVSVVAGYIAIGILALLTDQMAARVIPGFASMRIPPDYYFCTSLVTNTLYSVIGGFFCASIAREHARRATVSLIVLGEVMGVASQIVLWTIVPHWFALALLVTYPPAVWIGSRQRVANRLAPAGA